MSDLISRADIPYHKQLEPMGNGQYVEVEVAYKDDIDALPSAGPKTGEWVLDPNGMDWNIPAWRCSECGFVANYIGVEANGLGNNPLNWAGSKFCPQCGARITGYER